MGVPWNEAKILGTLMGEKIVLTELIAYSNLSELILNDKLSERTAIIASYALCGFSNFGSIGIQLGGIGVGIRYSRDLVEHSNLGIYYYDPRSEKWIHARPKA